MVSLELVLWSPPAYNSQAPYTWLSLFHAHRLLLKATVSQHERQLPKCSSTNSWNSYLLQLKSEEAPERHQKQFLGPLGEVFKWVQCHHHRVNPGWQRLADTRGHSALGSSIADQLLSGSTKFCAAQFQASISLLLVGCSQAKCCRCYKNK